MNRIKHCLILLCFVVPASMAQNFNVKAGGWARLPAANQSLHLEQINIAAKGQLLVPASISQLHVSQLRMSPGARLFISPRAEVFELNIAQGFFADGSVISGKGASGDAGVPGGNGANIKLKLESAELHNLTIDVRGGHGGSGWNGEPGKDGRAAACWGRTSKAGVEGGDGADGLPGGDGGNLDIYLANSQWLENIDFIMMGGNGGDPGQGAQGGTAGHQADCWLYSVGGADGGIDGSDGDKGEAGRQGVLRVH